MNEYPEFKYAQSQPLLYQFLKDHDPELYESEGQNQGRTLGAGRRDVGRTGPEHSERGVPHAPNAVRRASIKKSLV